MEMLRFVSLVWVAFASFNAVQSPTIYSGENVAVAELFTSEGCSSCPAADEMLHEMTGILAKENKAVVGLAFHITYWDHLGWKDPYGQEAFTDRQKKYCSVLQVPSIYTPQMIVNGQFQFVGSDPISFRQTVENVLASPPVYAIDAHATIEGDEIKIAYSLDKKPGNEILNIALIEVYAENNVKRGENKNKTLKHYNVVKTFDRADLFNHGEFTIKIPSGFDREDGAVVIFIQHKRTLKISAAVRINLL
jgi:hypothetical protein